MALVQKAERIAHDAVMQAAQQAAICGLTYTPPSNVHINLQHIQKVSCAGMQSAGRSRTETAMRA